jgi:hypothetical protein
VAEVSPARKGSIKQEEIKSATGAALSTLEGFQGVNGDAMHAKVF